MNSHRYVMTRTDFDTIILPCLVQFPWIPSSSEKDWNGDPISDAFWRLSSPVYQTQARGRESILGKCDDHAVFTIVQSMRTTYELLATAVLRKMPQVKLVATHQQCPACRKLDGTVMEIAELMAEYIAGNPRFPHPLPSTEEPRWCAAPYFADMLQPNQGDDPDFHAWLVKTLGKGPAASDARHERAAALKGSARCWPSEDRYERF